MGMSNTVYRIKSGRPLVWRTPSSLQVGVDPPVIRLDDIPDAASPLIYALQDGISSEGYLGLASQLRVPLAEAQRLRVTLEPSFCLPVVTPPTPVVVTGMSATTTHCAEALIRLGIPARRSDNLNAKGDEVVALLADYLIDPQWPSQLGPGTTPHLPVIFSDQTIAVGPLIVPGETPCLSCREMQLREREPHWLSIGSQLWSTPSPLATSEGATVAATLIAWSIGAFSWNGVDRPPGHYALWDAPSREVTVAHLDFHPQCRCRGL